jgi:hypothetical protein
MSGMRSPARCVLLLVVALVAALAATGTAPAQAVVKERVYGAIRFPQHDSPNIKLLWFDKGWNYLGQTWANGGGYAIKLAPGTYHLQFVDQRKPWVTTKYAPTDIQVTVGSHSVAKSVTMRPGAAITGVARAGGKPLRNARVVAANQAEQSFPTTADKQGRFAVGGLPAGKYCLFTFDRSKQHVDKCTWVGALQPRQTKNEQVTLRKKAGNLTVFVDTDAPNHPPAPPSTVTVTSKATGQWWSAKLRHGKAVFRGLYPGRYSYKYDGGGVWLAATGSVHAGRVRSGAMSFGDVRLTKRGAWVTGTVVDASAPSYTLENARVLLFDESGRQLAAASSDENGVFHLTGQITTQSVTLVVDPDPNTGGYMQSESYCVFQHTVVPGTWSVTTGQETMVGDVALDRAPDSKQPSDLCKSGARAGR